MDEKEVIKGYKVFKPDWTCRNFQYEVGKIYEMDDIPICCKQGFHFCLKAADCFNYYSFDSRNKVAEVIALGEIDSEKGDIKCCTNKIKIVREIPWDEVLRIVNTGDWNTGNRNTGNYNTGNRNTGNRNTGNYNTGNYNTGNRNTGNWNTGDWNTGNRNTGDWNTGNYNTGDYNTGNYNTGNRNTGNYNTGNRNTGNWNTGDWNTSSHNTGCFMTDEQKIFMFNKLSDWTYAEWLNSDVRYLLKSIPKKVVEWINTIDMKDEEKTAHPEYEITGGYLKVLNESESNQLWWSSLSNEEKDVIKSMPNFDKDIFKAITGIDMNNN